MSSVVWKLSLLGLNVWLGNTYAYIILHLQKFSASVMQTATCREESRPAKQAFQRTECDGVREENRALQHAHAPVQCWMTLTFLPPQERPSSSHTQLLPQVIEQNLQIGSSRTMLTCKYVLPGLLCDFNICKLISNLAYYLQIRKLGILRPFSTVKRIKTNSSFGQDQHTTIQGLMKLLP